MNITFLGHAGFVAETERALVVADPWLSSTGAFDSAWMQLPQNHHLGPVLRTWLQETNKDCFLYVSHEHRDHFDPDFIDTLPTEKITVVIPRFRRTTVHDWMMARRFREVITCADGEEVPIPGGSIKIYVEDSVLNRDSALLVRADGQTFFDINDCKLHDRIARINAMEGPVDVFAGQFSGAIWHPPSYEYDRKAYESISRKKMFGKFEAVARALDALHPKAYLASAGPAAFLDPLLFRVNFEPVNIFPRAPKFFSFLEKRLGNTATRLIEPMPGDVIDAATGDFVSRVPERLADADFEAYVKAYAQRQAAVFVARETAFDNESVDSVLERLREELSRKLAALALRDRVDTPLYAALAERPGRWLRVDFTAGTVEETDAVPAERRYTLVTRARDIVRVLDRRTTWEEYMLSLRMRLSRVPDVYDPVLHGFLTLEAEDLPSFCQAILDVDAKQERFLVQAGGAVYAVNRYCPHQGADLTQAWVEDGRYLVCPRHRWCFDLRNGGKCISNGTSLRAREATPAEVAAVVARALPQAPAPQASSNSASDSEAEPSTEPPPPSGTAA
jgi:UDP-MurNAc hydroxylase